MGFKISWLAFEGVSKAELLAALNFEDAQIIDEATESPFSAAELSTGWTIIFSNDFGWVESQSITHPKLTGRSVACQVHEGIMCSTAHGSLAGVELWSVVHDSDKGLHDLQIYGTPPSELMAIRARLESEQEADESEEVDYIFDISVELARALTGYRYDLWQINGERPDFTEIRPRR